MLVIVPVLLYLIVQIRTARKLRGVARGLALLPVIPVAWVVVLTADALRAGSNLWPILLIFACLFASLYIGIVWVIARKKQRFSAVENEAVHPTYRRAAKPALQRTGARAPAAELGSFGDLVRQ